MNTAFKRAWYGWFGIAALAAASGTAGWALGQHGHDERGPAPAHTVGMRGATVPQSLQYHGSGAAVQALPYATRTVETDDTAVASEPSCEPAAAGDGDSSVVDMERLERTLTDGTESERLAELTHALEAAIDLPPELLRRIYESDPSESVRLLAFTTYVDLVSDDRTEVRAALQSGLYDASSAVQAEAQRRLSELERYELALSETPPQGLP